MTTSPPSTFLLHLNSPSRITYKWSTGSPSRPPTSPAGMNSSEPSSRTSRNFSSVNPSKSGTWRSSSSVATVNSIPSATHFHLRSEGVLYPLCAEYLHHLLLLKCGASCKYDAIHRSPMPSPLHLISDLFKSAQELGGLQPLSF